MERQAFDLRENGQINEAFAAYYKAAQMFSRQGEPLKAAFFYASAATCWNILSGHQPMKQAAARISLPVKR